KLLLEICPNIVGKDKTQCNEEQKREHKLKESLVQITHGLIIDQPHTPVIPTPMMQGETLHCGSHARSHLADWEKFLALKQKTARRRFFVGRGAKPRGRFSD